MYVDGINMGIAGGGGAAMQGTKVQGIANWTAQCVY